MPFILHEAVRPSRGTINLVHTALMTRKCCNMTLVCHEGQSLLLLAIDAESAVGLPVWIAILLLPLPLFSCFLLFCLLRLPKFYSACLLLLFLFCFCRLLLPSRHPFRVAVVCGPILIALSLPLVPLVHGRSLGEAYCPYGCLSFSASTAVVQGSC